MSDLQSQPATPRQPPDLPPAAHEGAHEGPIRTPKHLILAVFFSFVIPIAVIVLLVEYVLSTPRPSAGTQSLSAEAVAARLAPVGAVVVKDLSDPSTQKTGEQVFGGQCTTCHTAGLVGAPKFGDHDAWAPRIQTGFAALLNSALHGKGNMGAQGGGDLTDLEVARAVVYMANKGGATFPEPQAAQMTAASASAPAAPTGPVTVASAATTQAMAAPAAAASASGTSTAALVVAEAAKPSAGGAAPQLYSQVCQVCHAAGVAGAPRLGDKAAWAPRIAAAGGIDGLTASAIKGKGAMPPRGGSMASDADVKAVVTYMVENAK